MRSAIRQSQAARAPAFLLGVLALAGLAISLYLTLTHWLDRPVVCSGLGSCELVNSSSYAKFGPVPVALLGVGQYLVLLALAAIWARRPHASELTLVIWAVCMAGAGYAAYLTYIEFGVLHAYCVWCLTSAGILFSALGVSTLATLRQQV